MRTPSWLVLLAVILGSVPALAQQVVILELDGDPSGRLRAQVEAAVRSAGSPELVPLAKYKEMAARRRLKGAAAMTPVGVMRVAKLLGLDAAVGGELNGRTFHVVIWDRAGQELWTKDLKAQGGLLSEDFAGKLARAISAAAQQGAARQTAQPTPSDDAAVVPDGSSDSSTGTEGNAQGNETGRHVVEPVVTAPLNGEERDSDLDTEGRRRRKAQSKAHAPKVRFALAGTTTWRSQCLRPGVDTCAQYEDLKTRNAADPKVYVPKGVAIDFTASAPYPGVAGELEVFPLAGHENRFLDGLGFVGHFGFGALVMKVTEESTQGPGPEKTVVSTDANWAAQLAWRFHFASGYGEPQAVGWVGARAGLQARSFSIDPNAGVSVPSSVRVSPTGLGHPVLGVDVSVPLSSYFRLEGSASYFLNPQTGPEQILGYGDPKDATGGVVSTGFSVDAGFSGDIWGPLGWAARVRYTRYADRYYGAGKKWTEFNELQNGGAAEETYLALFWGLTAQL